MKSVGMLFCLSVFSTAASILSFSAYAQEPDSASVSALADTQAMLQNPEARNKVFSTDPGAQAVNTQVNALTANPQTTEELYKISGHVLEDLVKETSGDPVKMLEIMSKAQADPKTLVDHLSEQNKASLHSVSTQIENSNTTVREPATMR